MPNIDQYAPGQFAVQQPDGSWLDFGGDQGAAERNYNTLAGLPTAPAAASAAPDLTATGTYGYMDPALQLAQQQYLQARLNQVEIPTYQLARDQNAWQRMQAMANLSGYIDTPSAVDENAALDWIWTHWGGLQQMAAQSGVNTADQGAIRNWIATNWLPNNGGKSPVAVAADLGMPAPSGGARQNTLARDQWLAALGLSQGELTGTYQGADTLANRQWQAADALARANLTGYYGGGQDSTAGALDAIAAQRPDVVRAFAGSLNINTPEGQRQAVQTWLNDPRNGDQYLGMTPEQIAQREYGWAPTRQNTLARDQMQQQNDQYYAGLRAQLSGPRDWIRYQQAQPTGAFGTMQASPSYESAGISAKSNTDWWRDANATGTGQVGMSIGIGDFEQGQFGQQNEPAVYPGGSANFDETTGTYVNQPATNTAYRNWWELPVRQPHQISAQQYNRMTPTQKSMQEGLWSAQGIVPEDAWQRMRAALPTGTASTQVKWV